MVKNQNETKLFESQNIRTVWDEVNEKWRFSIVDIVGVLTEQNDYTKSRKYWSVLKVRLKNEGSELATNCSLLKIQVAATDISIVQQPTGFEASKVVAQERAQAAKVAREQIEKSTGKSAISKLNAKVLSPQKIKNNRKDNKTKQ